MLSILQLEGLSVTVPTTSTTPQKRHAYLTVFLLPEVMGNIILVYTLLYRNLTRCMRS